MSVAHAITGGLSLAGALMSGVSKESASSKPASLSADFLQLLMSQITHQNPLEPMTNESMVSQLAQFNTIEKLNQLDEKMGSLASYQNLINSANLIGKNIKVFDPDTGREVTGKVDSIKVENGFPGVMISGKFYDITMVQSINN